MSKNLYFFSYYNNCTWPTINRYLFTHKAIWTVRIIWTVDIFNKKTTTYNDKKAVNAICNWMFTTWFFGTCKIFCVVAYVFSKCLSQNFFVEHPLSPRHYETIYKTKCFILFACNVLHQAKMAHDANRCSEDNLTTSRRDVGIRAITPCK